MDGEANHEPLHESLANLREEVNQGDLTDAGAKARLNELISDLERKLERPDDAEHHETLLRNVKESIGQLELEHPRATNILNQIMVALGNIGI